MRILIAEDDPALANYLARGLGSESAQIELAHDGDSAVAAFLREYPDLLLLDLELPGRSGLAVLAAVRELSLTVPVLVLSGRAEVETRIQCLELGADDCMPKPFSLRELRARCAALHRRLPLPSFSPSAASARMDNISGRASDQTAIDQQLILVIGCLSIWRIERRAEIGGTPLSLTNREFALLEHLALAGGPPVLRSTLIERIWREKPVETNALDVHLGALRKKLGCRLGAPQIRTVRGKGFQLAAPVALACALANEAPQGLLPLPFQQGAAVVSAGAAQAGIAR